MTSILGVCPADCDNLVIAPSCGDISVPYGTDNVLKVILKDCDDKAIAITVDTVRLTVKDGRGGALIFEKSNGPGQHTNPAQGETDFTVSASDIAAADPYAATVWVYEVRREAAGGSVSSHLAGHLWIEPTI